MMTDAQKALRAARWLLSASVLVLAMSAATPAWAWGQKGHRLAGALADSRLTPAARAAIAELLADDSSLPEKTLAGISDWADRIGVAAHPASRAWHYVNVPISAAAYREEDCDAGKGCVISKIREFRTVLADRTASTARRRVALLFFVHLVQDLHQPLHVGDDGDRGGSLLQVRFVGLADGTNLHRVWDVDLIDYARLPEETWGSRLSALVNTPSNEDWTKGGPVDWANESLALAKRAHQHPAQDTKIRAGDLLDDAYARYALPIVERRLAQSGARLAHELNQLFK